MKDFRKLFCIEVALCATFLNSIGSPLLLAKDVEATVAAADAKSLEKTLKQNTYTINFNNVSIVEFIRFVSKITGLNFVFEEADLPFTVTIVSEDAVSAQNVMAVLAQVLRIHSLNLLEQENSVLITKSKEVNQIPTIISGDVPGSTAGASAIVTRIFRIKNANVNSIAAIIRPMTSTAALIEVSNETRQLIVTDIITNVDKIATLLTSIDAPHTPLEIDSYHVRHISPTELISLTQEIISPFAEGNPLIFVPQIDTNTIFVVSTPYLIERSLTVMEDLDIPPKEIVLGQKSASESNVFLYKILYRSAQDLEQALRQISTELKNTPGSPGKLISALDEMRYVEDSNSLLFIGDQETVTKLRDILSSLDSSDAGSREGNFFLYKLQFAYGDALLRNVLTLLKDLPSHTPSDKSLIGTLKNLRWIKDNNSILITGPAHAIEQAKGFIAEFDLPEGKNTIPDKGTFFIYQPSFLSAQEVQSSLHQLAEGLKASGLLDPNLFRSISQMHYVESTNSLLFTGTPATLDRVKQLLAVVDSSASAGAAWQKMGNFNFLLYRLRYVSANQFMTSLQSFSREMRQAHAEDKPMAEAIESMRWIQETNSILFTGTPEVLSRIEVLAREFDSEVQADLEKSERSAETFFLYTPKSLGGPDLISILCDFKQNLIGSGVQDKGLYDTIDHLKWIDRTNTLLISGDEASIKKVQELLGRFDIPARGALAPALGSLAGTDFLVYKLQFHQGSDIQNALKQVAASLPKQDSTSSQMNLAEAIHSLQWVQITNSLLATGPQEVLSRLRELIQNLDVPLRQVFIEVLVIETSMINTLNFGLQWGSQIQYLNKANVGFGNFPVAQTPATTPTFATPLAMINATTTPKGGNAAQSVPFTTGFDLGVIGDIIMHKGKSFISLGSLVNALQTDSDTTIVMNPKVIAQDNNQSVIFIGQNIPFTGSLVQNTTGSASVLTSSNVEYRDVGVSLTITPILGNNDVVTLDIVNDISEQIANTTTQTNAQLSGLQTSHNHMETRVHVPNNHFVVLSGMINDSRTHYRTGLPCLGGLPIIGAAFSENDRTRNQNNVIIFMRPQIINTAAEYKAVTEHQEWLYKDEVGKSYMKEEFDHGVDMVKIPENE